jgi:hypothetical protein
MVFILILGISGRLLSTPTAHVRTLTNTADFFFAEILRVASDAVGPIEGSVDFWFPNRGFQPGSTGYRPGTSHGDLQESWHHYY